MKVKSITRFPGGKSRSIKYLKDFLKIPHDHYRECFLGGGSVFLSKDKPETSWINDYDYDIYCIHKTIQDNPDEMIDLIEKYSQPTIEDYNDIKDDIREDDITWTGFRSLYLNRCSFNGMAHGGPIGGRGQNGKYNVRGCWNKEKLIEKVRGIHGEYKDNVKITHVDFEELIKETGQNVLIYLDPPYIIEGNKLYKVGMSLDDHERLRDLLLKTEHNFLLSYRDCEEIRELYKDNKFILLEKSWTYSMMTMSSTGCKPSNELFIINKDFPIDLTEHLNQNIDNCLIHSVDKQGECFKCGTKPFDTQEGTNCESCWHLVNYDTEDSWPNYCSDCGQNMVKYKGLSEIKLNNNLKNNKMKTIELKEFEVRENMTSKEIEQEKYIKKVNNEIEDILLSENK